jgi:hypothetical protein
MDDARSGENVEIAGDGFLARPRQRRPIHSRRRLQFVNHDDLLNKLIEGRTEPEAHLD